jgi:hypothetical protein
MWIERRRPGIRKVYQKWCNSSIYRNGLRKRLGALMARLRLRALKKAFWGFADMMQYRKLLFRYASVIVRRAELLATTPTFRLWRNALLTTACSRKLQAVFSRKRGRALRHRLLHLWSAASGNAARSAAAHHRRRCAADALGLWRAAAARTARRRRAVLACAALALRRRLGAWRAAAARHAARRGQIRLAYARVAYRREVRSAAVPLAAWWSLCRPGAGATRARVADQVRAPTRTDSDRQGLARATVRPGAAPRGHPQCAGAHPPSRSHRAPQPLGRCRAGLHRDARPAGPPQFSHHHPTRHAHRAQANQSDRARAWCRGPRML